MLAILRKWYPELSPEELRLYCLLSSVLALGLGSYWLLRSLNETIFFKIAFPTELGWPEGAGCTLYPYAKFWSPWIVACVVLLYSRTVDICKRPLSLFYYWTSVYTLLLAAIAILLFYKQWYGSATLGWLPLAIAGWGCYFTVESYGSLMTSLIWAFAVSITNPSSARVGFPLVIAGAQLGSITGSACAMLTAYYQISTAALVVIASIAIIAIAAVSTYLVRTVNTAQVTLQPGHRNGVVAGMVEGLRLLATRPYLLGIAVVCMLPEAVAQIVDYQMKAQADSLATYSSAANFSWLLGFQGVCANLATLTLALFGTSTILRRLGTQLSLLIYPLICFSGILLLLALFYTHDYTLESTRLLLLWSCFILMAIIRGVSFGLNNPLKEMMYIPTSQDARYKTKGWIDMFGARAGKAGSAFITGTYKTQLPLLISMGSFWSLGIISIWLCTALYVGKRNKELIDENTIIS